MTLLSIVLVAQASFASPLIMGHRGSAGLRPEHTRASYEAAAEFGADFIEPDLVLTKDGALIARHENDITETTDVALKFPARKTTKTVDGQKITGFFTEDFTLAEIRTLKAKERLPFRDHTRDFKDGVMTFEEVIALVRELSAKYKRPIGVIPEIKHPTYFKSLKMDPVAPFVKIMKAQKLDQFGSPAIVQCFELGTLQELRRLGVKTRLFMLIDDLKTQPADFVASGDKRTYGDLETADGLKLIAKTAEFLGPAKDQLVNADGSATPVIALAHAAGLKVTPYTFRNEAQFVVPAAHGDAQAEYALFFKLGVDGVFTDYVDAAFKARAKFVAESSAAAGLPSKSH